MAAEAVDGVVEVTIAADDDLDQIRDAVAELGLPLYRLGLPPHVARRGVLRAGGSVMATATVTGAVYDRGYRPYDGPRVAAAAATLALYRASIRRALGLRRSWRQKVAPFVLLGIVTVPAIVNVGIALRDPKRDRSSASSSSPTASTSASRARCCVFVALTAPDIVCPDRRQRVLPLIFARPLTGVDYVVAKVGALFTILFAFSFLPQVVLFVGQALVSDSALDYIDRQRRRAVEGARRRRAARVVLRGDRRRDRVADQPPNRRRRQPHRPVSRLVDHGRDPRRRRRGAHVSDGSPAALINVLRLPLYLRDIVFLGDIDPDRHSAVCPTAERRVARLPRPFSASLRPCC